MEWQKDYPEWKKVLWGMVRAFFASFASMLGFMLLSAKPEDFSCWENAKKFLLPVGMGALTAGIVGLGKYIRDIFPESTLVQKLPF